MCGIVGFTGNRQVAPILLDGLSKLEYRGYDMIQLDWLSATERIWRRSSRQKAVCPT